MKYSDLIRFSTFLVCVILTACGGGGGGGGGGSTSGSAQALSAQVAGLALGQTIKLSNGTQTITVSANAPVSFAGLSKAATISVVTQPTDGTLCEVSDPTDPWNSSQTFAPGMTNVQINCSKFPSSSPNLPQVLRSTPVAGLGVSMAFIPNPKIIPVFFADTPNIAARVTFLRQLIASKTWGVLTQYGVGAATLEPSIVQSVNAPATTNRTLIESWITANAATWTPTSLAGGFLVFYMPPSSTDSDSPCGGGWHSAVYVGKQWIPYALVTGCGSDRVAQHEIMEGSADLAPGYGYYSIGTDSQIWAAMLGNIDTEIGDMCETTSETAPDIAGTIQGIWSNSAAAAGQDPCNQTSNTTPFFGAVPQLTTILTQLTGANHGVIVPAGGSVVVPVKLFSNGPLSGPMMLSVRSTTSVGNPTFVNQVTYAFDKSYGHNGDTVNLTISSPKGAPAATYTFTITANVGTDFYSFPGAVTSQ